MNRRTTVAALLLPLCLAACGGPAGTPPIASPSPGGSVATSTPVSPTSSPSANSATATPTRGFTLTAPYLAPFYNPRAALLAGDPDGRILIVDGPVSRVAPRPNPTPELYDPRTDTFSLTGSLPAGAGAEMAVSLNDGRVLVLTDWDHSPQIYDPATGQFSATGPMVDPRRDDPGTDVFAYTATTLRNGRVLIVGGVHYGYQSHGSGKPNTYLASAELFDPLTGKFSGTGSLVTARENQTATLLADGRVLIVGGDEGRANPEINPILSAEIYDPATGKFSAVGNIEKPRVGHTATLLRDGRVLIVGGESGFVGSDPASVEIYDPATGKFSITGSLQDGRCLHVAALLGDGRVLIAGGLNSPLPPTPQAELYDPATGTFSPAGNLDFPNPNSAILLPDGRVLLVDWSGPSTMSSELYWP